MQIFHETMTVELAIDAIVRDALRDPSVWTRTAVIDGMATAYSGDDGLFGLDDDDYKMMATHVDEQNLDNAIALLGRMKAAKAGA